LSAAPVRTPKFGASLKESIEHQPAKKPFIHKNQSIIFKYIFNQFMIMAICDSGRNTLNLANSLGSLLEPTALIRARGILRIGGRRVVIVIVGGGARTRYGKKSSRIAFGHCRVRRDGWR